MQLTRYAKSITALGLLPLMLACSGTAPSPVQSGTYPQTVSDTPVAPLHGTSLHKIGVVVDCMKAYESKGLPYKDDVRRGVERMAQTGVAGYFIDPTKLIYTNFATFGAEGEVAVGITFREYIDPQDLGRIMEGIKASICPEPFRTVITS